MTDSQKVKYVARINLKNTDIRAFEAIDECRRLGLPEITQIYIFQSSLNKSVSSECSEDFARKWFGLSPILAGDNTLRKDVSVELRNLHAGEVILDEINLIQINPELHPARILELFQQARSS